MMCGDWHPKSEYDEIEFITCEELFNPEVARVFEQ